VRAALTISAVAHTLFWGLNVLHIPGPLANKAEVPIAVEIVSADEMEERSKAEATQSADASNEKAERPSLPAERADQTPKREDQTPQPQPTQAPQPQPTQAPRADRTGSGSAPQLAQAQWTPQPGLPGGSWMESALGPAPMPTSAFDSTEIAANLSQDEIATFKAHLKKCWNPPADLASAGDLHVVLRVAFNPNGALRMEPTMLAASASADGPALMKTALRALQQCQPYAFLPGAKYREWKVLDLSFSPAGLTTVPML
jgi:hypothetical protein